MSETAPSAVGRDPGVGALARWLARGIDTLLLSGVAFGVWYAVGFYWSVGIGFGWLEESSLASLVTPSIQSAIAEVVMLIVLFLVIEPFCIGIAGTTPGKWLLGISVRRADGRKLGYGASVARTALVLSLGLGLYVPFLSAILALIQLFQVNKGEAASWDAILGAEVHHQTRPPLLWLAALAGYFATRVALQWDAIAARLD